MTGAVMADRRGRELERAFAFVDLAGFTALSEAHGDADAAHTALRLVRLTREVLVSGVQLVKSLGDAVMLAAEEPSALLDTVLALAGRARVEPGFLGLRAGCHLATPVRLMDFSLPGRPRDILGGPRRPNMARYGRVGY